MRKEKNQKKHSDMNKTEQQGREQTRTAGRAKKRPSKVRTTVDAAIEKVDTETKNEHQQWRSLKEISWGAKLLNDIIFIMSNLTIITCLNLLF